MIIIIDILVIGNGFDIVHNLPTSYMDFLEFLGKQLNEANDTQFNETYYKCKNNMWYTHFVELKNKNPKKTWIDFEEEIGHHVKEIPCEQSHEWRLALDEFTDSLNYYFYNYVNTLPVNVRLPDIYNNKFEYVLTFNYTNTYERIYGPVFDPANNIQYSFVHGKAGPNSNIVLGCDNLLTEGFTKSSSYNERVPFEKTFQRTEKDTDKSFSKWFSNADVKFKIHIFGHSLGMTDKSLLIDLILHPRSTIIVYYHSEANQKQLISNLIYMLGVDNYNRKAPYIIFKKQSEPVNYSEQDQKHQFEKLFSSMDLSLEQFRELINKANQMKSDKEYIGVMINHFFDKNIDFFPKKQNVLNTGSADQVKYLQSLCVGDIEYNYDELVQKCKGLSSVSISTVSQNLNSRDRIVRIRWNHIMDLLSIKHI